MSYGSERRRHPRAEIEWPATIRQDDLTVDGVIKNLSHSGALVCSDHKLLPGERIRLAIMLLDRLPLVVDAEVIRSSIHSSDSLCGLFEMGVRFVAISDEDLRLIDSAVSERLRSKTKERDTGKPQEIDSPISIAIERRRFPRVSAAWSVSIDAPQGFVSGTTVNVSVGGAFICCKQLIKQRKKFQMAFFNVPSLNRPLPVTAEVVRSDFFWGDDGTLSYGIGVKFVDISDEDRAFVSELISAQLKFKSAEAKDDEIGDNRTPLEVPQHSVLG